MRLLEQKLANFASEASFKNLSDWDKWKSAVAGDTIITETKFGDPFKLKTYARFVHALDDVGDISEGGSGAPRRMNVIKFNAKIVSPDKGMQANVQNQTEIDGYFTHLAIPNLVQVLKHGFTPILDSER